MKTKLPILLLSFFLISFCSFSQTIRYVKQAFSGGVSGNGSSWASASFDLQAMINASVAGDEIWVAKGIYKPNVLAPCGSSSPCPNADANKTFYLNKNIKIYGGFEGNETNLNQRSIAFNRTIFSGDIDNNDTQDIQTGLINSVSGIAGTNAHHIFIVIDGATIDGCIFNAGAATGTMSANVLGVGQVPRNHGGAIYSATSDIDANTNLFFRQRTLNIKNCLFLANTADYGGGIYAKYHTFNLLGDIFEKNSANFGAATFFASAYAGSVFNCVAVQNVSTNLSGGVIHNQTSIVSTEHSTFVANSGSAYLSEGSTVRNYISYSIFKNNAYSISGAPAIGQDIRQIGNTFSSYIFVNNNALQNALNSTNYPVIYLAPAPNANFASSTVLFENETNFKGEDNRFFTVDDGLRLNYNSAGLGTGSSSVAVFTDILNKTRISAESDMGAYQNVKYTTNAPIYINNSVTNLTNHRVFDFELRISNNLPHYFLDRNNDKDFLIGGYQRSGTSPIEVYNTVTRAELQINNYYTDVPAVGGTPYVLRRYEYIPSEDEDYTPNKTGKVFLFFTQNDFDVYNNQAINTVKLPNGPLDILGKSNLKIKKYNGFSFDNSGLPATYTSNNTNTGTPVIPTTIDPADTDIKWDYQNRRWEVSFEVTSFSGFFVVGEAATTLPVQLAKFTGKSTEHGNQLAWKTAQMSNFSHFELQKSNNNGEFTTIGLVQINKTENYEFFDDNITEIKQYYRLKMIDLDGKFSFSKTIALESNLQNSLIIYPNPVVETLQFKGTFKVVSFQIKNLNGRKMLENNNGETKINVSNLPKGIYIYEAHGIDNKKVSLKFLKQ